MLQTFQFLQPVARGVSHTFDDFPLATLRVYFTPQPLPGFTLQGFSIRCSQSDSSPNLYLHAGFFEVTTSASTCAMTPNRRLQGFAPHRSTLSKQQGLTATLPAPFLRFTLPGCPLQPPPVLSHSLPLMTFIRNLRGTASVSPAS